MKVVKINSDEQFKNEMQGNCLILFFHTSCPHCHDLKPIWSKAKENNANRNMKVLEVGEQAFSKINHPLISNIQGFPSIIRTQNGEMVESIKFPMNEENVNNFVKNTPNNSTNESNTSLHESPIISNGSFNELRNALNKSKSKVSSKSKRKSNSKPKSKSKRKGKPKGKPKGKR
jgi:thioredoxin-like negative regulator of GroEL